ncbi:MAG: hypothetical protein MZV64_70600 [Ignavibacteriales bacterium]|nr:hypothetical protein [Ignavibacteriales bacterium]
MMSISSGSKGDRRTCTPPPRRACPSDSGRRAWARRGSRARPPLPRGTR